MGGKAAILMVLGFSMIVMVFLQNNNRVSTTAVENLTEYFLETKAENIANAAANIRIMPAEVSSFMNSLRRLDIFFILKCALGNINLNYKLLNGM